MPLEGKIALRTSFLESLAHDLGSKKYDPVRALQLDFLDGSGAGQANKLFVDSVSVAQSVNTDLDLVGSALQGAFGTVSFTAIKGIIVIAGAANPGNLTVGNVTNGIVAPFGAATHSIQVAPGGLFAVANPSAAGWPVTGSTADLLRIASAAAAGTYTFDVIIIGI